MWVCPSSQHHHRGLLSRVEMQTQRRINYVNTDNIFKGEPDNNTDKSKENITNAVSSFVISVESEVVPSLTLWELP